MRKKFLLATLALSFVTVFLVAGMGPVLASETRTEHLKAQGAVTIDVEGRPKFSVLAQHWKQSDFYPGSAERIEFSAGKESKRFEDNPWRYAFSVEVGGGPSPNRILTGRDTIQVLRMNDALKVYWTVPIMLTSTVVIPPATLMFRADGDVLPPTTEYYNYPISGWSAKYEMTELYNAKVTFDCPDWGYSGPVPITDPHDPQLATEGMMTWTHP